MNDEKNELTELAFIELPGYPVVELNDQSAAAIWKKYWTDATVDPGEAVPAFGQLVAD